MCRARALSVSRPGFFVSGADGFCVGSRRSLCPAPALSVSGPGAPCVGSRRSLCRGLTVSVSRPVALSVRPRRFLCRGPALLVSDSGAHCVRARRSLCLCRGPALSPSLCWSQARALCVRPRRPSGFAGSQLRSASSSYPRSSGSRAPSSHPCATHQLGSRATHPVHGPQLRSACRPSAIRSARPPLSFACPSSDPRATHPVRGPQLRSACQPSSPARYLFPGENPKPYCLGDKDNDKHD